MAGAYYSASRRQLGRHAARRSDTGLAGDDGYVVEFGDDFDHGCTLPLLTRDVVNETGGGGKNLNAELEDEIREVHATLLG